MRKNYRMLTAVLLFLAVILVAEPAFAKTKHTRKYELNHGEWKSGRKNMFYHDVNGKRVTGMVRIKNHTYLFDKSGVQKIGWCKRKGNYYFFHTTYGKKGCMVAGQKINGIRLGKDGVAKISTEEQRKKIEVLAECARIVRSQTYAAMSRKERLKTMFTYTMTHFSGTGGGFEYSEHWELEYARHMLAYTSGTCYHYGVIFAYFADAIGYHSARAVSSGGHGWAEVDGCVCDPSQQKVDKKHSLYMMPMELSGKDGRPYYSRARKYVKNIFA